MKLLGIDYGRRRIGVAATDDSGICIRGITTIDQKKCSDPFNILSEIITKELPEAIVFGVPLGPRDEETVMSREIREFAARLNEKIGSLLPVHFIDESFSSQQAEYLLRSRKKKQRQDKNALNRLAACAILETYQRQQRCEY